MIGPCYTAFEVTIARRTKHDVATVETKLRDLPSDALCGLRWGNESSWGLKLTIEFSNKQSVQVLLQIPELTLQDVEGIPPDSEYNRTAHQRIHGKVESMVQDFKNKQIHPAFSALGIDGSSVVERICTQLSPS
jgi:hypothetical protein